ncbi:MAG: oligosaccharide flippase family protein [Desulfovibrio sp.]|nr:oligosaccharide flippase family protein [Desulfovibrio sp.]MBI4958395.1 oligosaccharide flippase family protein [Desulfovibrio sp.]
MSALAGQWAATLYCAVLSTLLSFALGRFLGPDAFGVYSYILTMVSLFAIFQDGGFSTLIFREAAHPSGDLALEAPIARLALGHTTLVTAAGLVLVWLLPLDNKSALCLAIAYYALFSAGNFLSADLKGHGLFEREAKWRILVRTLTVAAVALALAAPFTGPALLFSGWVAGMGIALALPMAASIRLKPSFKLKRDIYRSCGAFLLISAATTIYFKSDIILLTQLTGDSGEVGQYAAAYRLIEAAVLFCTPLTQLFFRKLRMNMHQPDVFRRAFRTQLAIMCALAAFGTALAMWLGPMVIRLAFGDKFAPAESLCLWLLPSLLFILPNGILTQALIAIGKEGFYARVTIVTAIANILFNLALIPWLGAKGSALATVVTEALLAAGLGLGYLRKS